MTFSARSPRGATLPDFPWDSLEPAKKLASAHPDGLVNLSVGAPVDEPAPGVQEALCGASHLSGYPQTHGTPELRKAIMNWSARRYNILHLTDRNILPVIGTKEIIAGLPTLMGVTGDEHTIVIPEVAYPTYEVAALMAGARIIRADSLTQIGPRRVSLMYINSPSNPTGAVLGINHLRKVISWARQHDVCVIADECYIGLGWDKENKPVSILDDDVCDGDYSNLLAVHSLSKSSNLASYRAGFVAGDETLVSELLAVRKHTGFMVPGPVQEAFIAALSDDAQEKTQRDRYRNRREILLAALTEAGFTIDHSEAGLYIWCTRDEDCWETVDWFARNGILVAPGSFYGPKGTRYIRIGLTGTDEQVEQAAQRIVAAASHVR